MAFYCLALKYRVLLNIPHRKLKLETEDLILLPFFTSLGRLMKFESKTHFVVNETLLN